MKLTKASGHQYKRLKYVAVMGIALGQLLREAKLIDNCQMLETDASWGYRLSKMKVRRSNEKPVKMSCFTKIGLIVVKLLVLCPHL